MRIVRGTFLTAALCAGLVHSHAETRALDTYRSIVDRNAFGLKPIEPPKVEEPKGPEKPAEKTEFYLTGITRTKGVRKAYLVNKDPNKKNYEEKYYALTIGDRQGDLTLNEIDDKGRRVKVTHQGKELWLDFKSNAAPASAPVMAGVPGAMGQPGVPPPPGVGMPLPAAGVNPAGSSQPPATQPNLYQNNPNRRVPRGANTMNNSGYVAPIPAPGVVMNVGSGGGSNQEISGPQTDAEVVIQAANLLEGENKAPVTRGRYQVPPSPPAPRFGGTP